MHVYFDLDNTLVDSEGDSLRPGIKELLSSLTSNGIKLSIWTASTDERAKPIIDQLDIDKYFNNFVFREDYDPYAEGHGKDIRYLDGDILVDDDPWQIEYVRSIGKRGFLISPYIKSQAVNGEELERLHAMILHQTEFLIDRKIASTNQPGRTRGGSKESLAV